MKPCCTRYNSPGPVGGLVSQNCVCSSCPPGALKQQRSCTIVVLWQLNCGFEHVAGVPPRTVCPPPSSTCAPPKASFDKLRTDGREAIVSAIRFSEEAEEDAAMDDGAEEKASLILDRSIMAMIGSVYVLYGSNDRAGIHSTSPLVASSRAGLNSSKKVYKRNTSTIYTSADCTLPRA